ncbi:hypothetical protein V1477_021135 [Vespula maculifrons]|uniref:Uncharacterized protein n=1 Tax=Vespula maculifrons TaxID=7453 RepID=A0ABD2AH95_VESMC
MRVNIHITESLLIGLFVQKLHFLPISSCHNVDYIIGELIVMRIQLCFIIHRAEQEEGKTFMLDDEVWKE